MQPKAKVSLASFVSSGGLAEIYQSQSTQQALLQRLDENEYERITPFVKCRDFLVDSYSFALAKKDFAIYGFQFFGSKHQPSWDEVLIQLHFQDKTSQGAFLKHIHIIHDIEEKNKIPLTTVTEIEGSDDFVIRGDKYWLTNCLTFSLYSLLLRIACYTFDSKKDWVKSFIAVDASDSAYIASIPKDSLTKVLGNLELIKMPTFCGFDPAKDSVSSIHHNSGFVSVFGWHSEINPGTVKKNNHWKLVQERGLETKVA